MASYAPPGYLMGLTGENRVDEEPCLNLRSPIIDEPQEENKVEKGLWTEKC